MRSSVNIFFTKYNLERSSKRELRGRVMLHIENLRRLIGNPKRKSGET